VSRLRIPLLCAVVWAVIAAFAIAFAFDQWFLAAVFGGTYVVLLWRVFRS